MLGAQLTEQIVLDDGVPSAVWYHVADKSYDLVYTSDWTGCNGRLHHVAFATDQREDILRAADVMLEAGIHIETGPHKHAIQQTFFLYIWEPGGNRIELCNAGARLVLAPDWRPISWTRAERAKGQAWGLQDHRHLPHPRHAAGGPCLPPGRRAAQDDRPGTARAGDRGRARPGRGGRADRPGPGRGRGAGARLRSGRARAARGRGPRRTTPTPAAARTWCSA